MGESAEQGIVARRYLLPDLSMGLVAQRPEVLLQGCPIHHLDDSLASGRLRGGLGSQRRSGR
jgi:hypothetical protein